MKTLLLLLHNAIELGVYKHVYSTPNKQTERQTAKNESAQCRHSMRSSARPLPFRDKTMRTGYSRHGDRSHEFSFSCFFGFRVEPARDTETDARTGKTVNTA